MSISKREEKALFRFSLIYPLTDSTLSDKERAEMVRRICEKEHVIPYSRKTHIARSTVMNWLRTYKKEGTIDSLAPRGRSDKGVMRTMSGETLKRFVKLYHDNEDVPVTVLVEKAYAQGVFAPGEKPSMACIYTLLRKERGGYQPDQTDRRAYRAPVINDMWQSDCMHGPKVVLSDGRAITAKLFICIDNRSRLICGAAWYRNETAESFMDCMWGAFQSRGLPNTLYVDNGSSYRDDRVAYGCASIGVRIVYAKPYTPQGKGVVERLNRTVRQRFLSMLPDRMLTLEELNALFCKWVDEYNRRPHPALGDGVSPLKCYLSELKAVRPAPADLPLHFRRREERTVRGDRTVSVNGMRLEAPVGYAGRRIELRWFDHDLAGTCEGFLDGRSIGMLRPADLEANYDARRNVR